MLSKKFEQLVLEHPELRRQLRQIYEKLQKAGDSYLLQESVIASLIDAPVETVRVVLELLAESGGITLEDLHECKQCGNLIYPEDDYCSQCLGDKNNSSPAVRYRVMPLKEDGRGSTELTANR